MIRARLLSNSPQSLFRKWPEAAIARCSVARQACPYNNSKVQAVCTGERSQQANDRSDRHTYDPVHSRCSTAHQHQHTERSTWREICQKAHFWARPKFLCFVTERGHIALRLTYPMRRIRLRPPRLTATSLSDLRKPGQIRSIRKWLTGNLPRISLVHRQLLVYRFNGVFGSSSGVSQRKRHAATASAANVATERSLSGDSLNPD